MAQFVTASITIEGKAIRQFSSLALTQSINEHHRFRLVCPTETIDGTAGVLNQSKNFVGGKITIQINAVETAGTLKFSGLVTQVEASRHSSHAGDIIISGFSPTVLLDSGPHCKSWEKKAVKNIAQDVLKHFPQNVLQPKIAPVNGETLSYTVQYKETAWQFLNRMAATYGEWFFYDGQKLVFGPPQGEKAKLVYGSNLEHFSMALQVRPAKFQLMSYDYMNSQVYDATPAGIAGKAGLNDWGKHALQKSEQFYASQPKYWHNQFLTNKKQLDDYTNVRAAAQGSGMVNFNGSCSQPGLQVGGNINVQGRNIFSGGDEAFGDYVITSVQHYCDGQGNYSNNFEAIPASIKVPPVATVNEPRCETQSAFVTDNHDPKGLGRIRVKFHWMNGSEKSPWLRVTTPHAGGGKGMFFIPEVGEEVIVGFEGDSSVKPYVIGAVYHGKANNSYANAGNDVKALQSRSGNKMVFHDAEGSVHLSDAKGNDMKMDGKGNITVKSTETIVLVCGESKIEMKKDGTITINGKKITVNGIQSIDANSAEGTISVKSKANTNINSTAAGVIIEAAQNFKAKGTLSLDLESPANSTLKGAKVLINS